MWVLFGLMTKKDFVVRCVCKIGEPACVGFGHLWLRCVLILINIHALHHLFTMPQCGLGQSADAERDAFYSHIGVCVVQQRDPINTVGTSHRADLSTQTHRLYNLPDTMIV